MHADDARLAAADHHLPGMATILDDAVLGDWIGEERARPPQLTYLRYRPGTSLVAGLELPAIDGGPGRGFAAAYRRGSPKVDKAMEWAHRNGLEIIADRSLGVVIGPDAADR